MEKAGRRGPGRGSPSGSTVGSSQTRDTGPVRHNKSPLSGAGSVISSAWAPPRAPRTGPGKVFRLRAPSMPVPSRSGCSSDTDGSVPVTAAWYRRDLRPSGRLPFHSFGLRWYVLFCFRRTRGSAVRIRCYFTPAGSVCLLRRAQNGALYFPLFPSFYLYSHPAGRKIRPRGSGAGSLSGHIRFFIPDPRISSSCRPSLPRSTCKGPPCSSSRLRSNPRCSERFSRRTARRPGP